VLVGGYTKGLPVSGRPFVNDVRRRPTLPHPGGCSTIGAGRLSFRVRNGTGRFPAAMTAVTLWNSQLSGNPTHEACGRGCGPRTAQWTRIKLG
jgi:hypothetical protein